MAQLRYIRNRHKFSRAVFQAAINQLPSFLHPDVTRYRLWQDQQAALLGKLLLRFLLKQSTGSTQLLNNFAKDQYQRPFVSQNLDFNISHTQGLVICAMTSAGKLGVDVEALKGINISEFKRVFSQRELNHIREANNPQHAFFLLWTTKEAIMKADGRGFYLPPQSFEGLKSPVNIEGKSWKFSELDLGDQHVGQLALESDQSIQLVEMDLPSLLL